jgi:hypothetical protein
MVYDSLAGEAPAESVIETCAGEYDLPLAVLQGPDPEWVAQVSLLRPGFLRANRSSKHPALEVHGLADFPGAEAGEVSATNQK